MRLKRNHVRLIAKTQQGHEELAEYGDVWRIVKGPVPVRFANGRPAWSLHPVGGYGKTHRRWVLLEDPHFTVYQGNDEFKPIRGRKEYATQINREGREPASDLKKRLVCLCEEAGLTIREARMLLGGDRRVILVVAASSEWPHKDNYQLVLETQIGTNGTWSGTVKIAAPALLPSEDFYNIFTIPSLKRLPVPLTELSAALHETLEQQRLVIAARTNGDKGPWVYGEAKWKVTKEW